MNKTGFTLIEVVMVVLIIGIICGIVINSMNDSISVVRLDAARLKLISDILYAQTLAVTQQVNHGVVFDPAAETYSIYRSTASNIVKDPLTRAPFTVNFQASSEYRGVSINATSFGSPTTNKVEFNSFGTPSDGTAVLSANGTVTLGYGASTAIVTVTKNTGKTS